MEEGLDQLYKKRNEAINRIDDNKNKIIGLREDIKALEAAIADDQELLDSYRRVISDYGGDPDLGEPSVINTMESPKKSDDLRASPLDNSNNSPKGEHEDRKPSEMLKPEFKGIAQNDVILEILRAEPTKKFRIDEMVKLAYDFDGDEEYKKARNTMGASLWKGVKEDRWQGNRGNYYLKKENLQ